MQIGFIGAGKMASAIIKGLVSNKVVDSDDIIVNDVSIDTLSEIKTTYNVNVTMQKKEVLRYSDVVILAVKPQNMKEVIEDLKNDIKIFDNNIIFVSIAAGISIESLEKMFYINDIPFINNETIYYLRDYLVIFVIAGLSSTPLLKNIIKKLRKTKMERN